MSRSGNKLQFVRMLCTNTPRYAQIKKGCKLHIRRGFDDPRKLQGS